jgi:hypothetical protein
MDGKEMGWENADHINQELVVDSCGHGNEPSGFIKGR